MNQLEELVELRAQNDYFREELIRRNAAQVQQQKVAAAEENSAQQEGVQAADAQKAGRPGHVLLFGSVRNSFVDLKPGQDLKLLEAILRAGPNEFANLKKVKLSRLDPVTKKVGVETINVEAIKKDSSKDIVVVAGDRIEIPERGIVF